MFTLRADIKSLFFDRSAVANVVDSGTRRALSKFGAFVRRADKSSLKYGKGKSRPGQPPIVHRSTGYTKKRKNRKTGATSRQPSSPLRELIFFAFDPSSKSVVIGPTPFKNGRVGNVARVIEEGGTAPVLSRGRLVIGHYAPRPHTQPAFKSVLPQAAAMFKSQIR